MNAEIGIIGTSIWQQNMQLLERLTIDRESREARLQELKIDLGLDELIYLATCNRVEFIYVSSGRLNARQILHRVIDAFVCGSERISFFPNDFYHFTGKEAITHLFRTTSSLESLVVGETQITGQFKDAYHQALSSSLAGEILDRLAREALLTAKAVKRETKIGTGALSMASLAAGELKKQLVDCENPLIALVGSGPMTEKLAKYFAEDLTVRVLFVNRTLAKAESLAERFGGAAVSLEQFKDSPPKVDGIVSATAAREPVFEAEFLEQLSEASAKIICVDLAVPRDFSDAFSGSAKVTLIDIPALKSRQQGNRRQKFVEAAKANEIVREAVNKYLAEQIEVSLKPIFHEGYQESVKLARTALNDLFAKRVKSLDEHEQEAVIRLVERLIGHSSYQPVRKLSDRLVQLKGEVNISERNLTEVSPTETKLTRREAV